MITELRKSIAAILYERTTSPLFGSLIISWSLINWKIIYLTLFMEAYETRPYSKMEYIVNNLSDPWFIYCLPLISTGVLVTIVPFVSNGSYYLNQKFRQWRVNQKNKIEGETLITKEQYVQIQKEIARKDSEFKDTLTKRQDDIKTAMAEIDNHRQAIKTSENDKQQFKVIQAIYGAYADRWKDVTQLLNGSINGDTLILDVKNENLGSVPGELDPAPGHWKFLFATFQYKGKISSFSAIEDDHVDILEGKVMVMSRRHHLWIIDAIKSKQHDPETHREWAEKDNEKFGNVGQLNPFKII